MVPELWSIVALIAVFALGAVCNINLGILALTATFLLAATVAGVPFEEVYPLFPGDLFILLFGLMFLLSLAKSTGAIDWVVNVAIAGARGRIILIPWMLFALSALTAALGPGALPLLAGTGLAFARRHNISRLLLALMIVHGSQAGGFSPVTPYSVVIRSLVEGAGHSYHAMAMFVGAAVFNTVAALIGFSALGGWQLLARHESIAAPGTAERVFLETGVTTSSPTATTPRTGTLRPTFLQLVALASVVALLVVAGFFKTDLGATALVAAAVLALVIPASMRSGAVGGVAWPAILLVTGMVSLMSLLQKVGTVEWVVGGLQAIGSGLLALLIVCYIAGVVSAVASSFATLAATMPLALSIVGAVDMSGLGVTLVATAIVVSSTIVDISPFSTYGAIVLGAAEPQEQSTFQKALLKYAGVIVSVAPGAAWAALVFPAWLLR